MMIHPNGKEMGILAGVVAVGLMVSSCGPKESAMKKADLNQDNRISTAEMDRALVNAVFDQADRNRNGSVDYREWRRIFPEMSEEEFSKHDLGSRGSFTREEAVAYCAKKKTFDKLVGKVDTSGNGFIDPSEAEVFRDQLRAAEGKNSVQKLDSLLNR